MFKRANKITSLLVTAAAVMSLVPAYAADVKKVDSQDGTIYNAVAYKDGKFYIDGEVNDKDEATYYVADGKYNNLSDVDAGSDIATYGTKYVDIQGGDYFVDLTTGKVTDDSISDDSRDDAASNLRKKVKADTDGRYLKDASTYAADTLKTFTDTDEISGNKFGEVWYKTTLKADDATNASANSSLLNVYTDGAGNYIDADYNLGKIKVTTTAGSVTKSIYVENTDDTYDAATNGTVSASVVQTGVLGQDKDYIYRTATVTVTTTSTAATISAIDGKSVTVTATGKTSPFTVDATGKVVSFKVIQKISKAQNSDEIGGAKYAKTVNTYVVADSDGYNDAFDTTTSNTKYAIANGKIISYTVDGAGNVKTQTASLKTEDGLYYVDFADQASEDVEFISGGASAVDVDADGNVYRLDGGYVYQWNNDEDWDKLYKVDGSFNKINVYDKNNMVVWNEDDEVYSVIGGKTTKTDDTTTTPVVTVKAGWAKAADGTWTYAKADGTKATGWLQDGAAWYYLNATGTMATGWVNDKGTWYYLAGSGAMLTGWVNDNGTWYYLAGSGAMLSNTVVDGYKLGASGAWVK
jgi:hypothetical protein